MGTLALCPSKISRLFVNAEQVRLNTLALMGIPPAVLVIEVLSFGSAITTSLDYFLLQNVMLIQTDTN